MTPLVGNLSGLVLGSLVFLLPFQEPAEREEAVTYILISVAALAVSLGFQYFAVSAQREGYFEWKGSRFDRVRDPKSFTFAVLICAFGSSLLFAIGVYLLTTVSAENTPGGASARRAAAGGAGRWGAIALLCGLPAAHFRDRRATKSP